MILALADITRRAVKKTHGNQILASLLSSCTLAGVVSQPLVSVSEQLSVFFTGRVVTFPLMANSTSNRAESSSDAATSACDAATVSLQNQ